MYALIYCPELAIYVLADGQKKRTLTRQEVEPIRQTVKGWVEKAEANPNRRVALQEKTPQRQG